MEIDKIHAEIDTLTEQFESSFRYLNVEQLNWKPSADRWSIAQNLDHIMTINRSYYPVVEEVSNGIYTKPFLGRFDFIVNFFGKLLLKSIDPKNRKKARTFPIWEPSKSELPADILNQFVNHQEELKAWIVDHRALIEKNPVISSPASINIVYRLRVAIYMIILHEERHFLQASEVMDLLTGQPSK